MTAHLSTPDRSSIDAIVTALETAWNNGDGPAFGVPFAPDADFVTIRAEHFHGRGAIAGGHAAIFRTIYLGSRIRSTIDSARLIHPDVALVHVESILDAPSGPLAGRHRSMFSLVLQRSASGWEIASLHNTLEPPTP